MDDRDQRQVAEGLAVLKPFLDGMRDKGTPSSRSRHSLSVPWAATLPQIGDPKQGKSIEALPPRCRYTLKGSTETGCYLGRLPGGRLAGTTSA